MQIATRRLTTFGTIGLLLATAELALAGNLRNPETGRRDYCLTVEEEDASPQVLACQPIEVSNTTLADDGDGRFSLDTSGTATTGWTDSGTTVNTTTATDNVVMADNQWLGLGSAAGRIEWDDQTVDEVNVLNARVGIGNVAPDSDLQIGETEDATRSYAQIDAEAGQTAADCDAAAEIGRVFLDTNAGLTADQICVCRRNALDSIGWGCVTF